MHVVGMPSPRLSLQHGAPPAQHHGSLLQVHSALLELVERSKLGTTGKARATRPISSKRRTVNDSRVCLDCLRYRAVLLLQLCLELPNKLEAFSQ